MSEDVTIGAPSANGTAKAPLPYGLEGAEQPQVAVVHLGVDDAPDCLVAFTTDGVPHLYQRTS